MGMSKDNRTSIKLLKLKDVLEGANNLLMNISEEYVYRKKEIKRLKAKLREIKRKKKSKVIDEKRRI